MSASKNPIISRSTASRDEVLAKFAKEFAVNVKPVKPAGSRIQIINGIPHKPVNGKLVALTRV